MDGHDGRRVVDYKFQHGFDTVHLWDSFQWIAYLAMLGEQYDEFEYSVFVRGQSPMARRSIEAFIDKWRPLVRDEEKWHLDEVAKSIGTVNWYEVREHESHVLTRHEGIEEQM